MDQAEKSHAKTSWMRCPGRPAIDIAIALAMMSGLVCFPARAEFEAGDFYPTVTGGLINGNGRNDDVRIATARFGLVHNFRERLGFFSEAAVFLPSGHRGGREVDTSALGCVFGLRWHFLTRPRFGLYIEWGMGFLVAKDAFPPQGTKFNGASHFGMGASVLAFGGNDIRWRVEATYEFADEDDSPGGGVAVDVPLARRQGLRLQLADQAAELVDETIWKASVRVYRETDTGRVVVGYSRQEFNVFSSDIYDLQVERVLTDVSTVLGLVSYEEKNLADDRVYGGLFITVYPAPFAAINTGVGFERQQEEFFDSIDNLNDAGFNLGLEVAPGFVARLGMSAFFNIGIGYDTKLAGIRFQPGSGESLVERHRRGGLMMVR